MSSMSLFCTSQNAIYKYKLFDDETEGNTEFTNLDRGVTAAVKAGIKKYRSTFSLRVTAIPSTPHSSWIPESKVANVP